MESAGGCLVTGMAWGVKYAGIYDGDDVDDGAGGNAHGESGRVEWSTRIDVSWRVSSVTRLKLRARESGCVWRRLWL